MLWHGAAAGAFDLKGVLLETLTSMRRAGLFTFGFIVVIVIEEAELFNG